MARGRDLTLFLLAALAVVVIAVLAVRMVPRLFREPTAVWVAKGDLPAGTTVRAEHLEKKRVNEVPPGALDRRLVEGRTVQRTKKPGESFSARDFEEPRLFVAPLVPEGRVLFVLATRTGTLPVDTVAYGDRVSVIANGRANRPGEKPQEPAVVAEDVFYIGADKGGAGRAAAAQERGPFGVTIPPPPPRRGSGGRVRYLSLAVRPEEVLPLSKLTPDDVSAILYSKKDVEKGTIQPLPTPVELRSVELVLGASRRQVPLEPPR